jgi:hypothetical protein
MVKDCVNGFLVTFDGVIFFFLVVLEEFSHGFTLSLSKMNASNSISSTIGLFYKLEICKHHYIIVALFPTPWVYFSNWKYVDTIISLLHYCKEYPIMVFFIYSLLEFIGEGENHLDFLQCLVHAIILSF